MKDVPQPSPTRYDVDDQVCIYVGEDDLDALWHETRCRIVEVLEDDLASETDRELDGVLYRLVMTKSGDELPVTFRHRDLVPAE